MNYLSRAAEEKSVAVASSTGYVKKAPIVVSPSPSVANVTATSAESSSSSSVVKKMAYSPITKPITVSPNKPSVVVTSSAGIPVVTKEDKQSRQSEFRNQKQSSVRQLTASSNKLELRTTSI